MTTGFGKIEFIGDPVSMYWILAKVFWSVSNGNRKRTMREYMFRGGEKQKERNWAEFGEGIGAQRWKSCRENKMHDMTKRKALFE